MDSQRSVPFAAATINKSLVVVKTILGDAVEQGHLTENPAARVKALKEPDREEGLHVLHPEEIARLLDAADEPWRTLYAVAVQTGLRRGELLALRWSDLDLRKGLLFVRRSLGRVRERGAYAVRAVPLKTRHARRTVDLSPATIEALRVLPAGDDPERDFVFRSRAGGPIDPDNVGRVFRRYLTLGVCPRNSVHVESREPEPSQDRELGAWGSGREAHHLVSLTLPAQPGPEVLPETACTRCAPE